MGRGMLAWRSKFGSHVDDSSYPKLTVPASDRNSDDVSDYDCLEYARVDQRHPFAKARGRDDSEFLGAVGQLDNKAVWVQPFSTSFHRVGKSTNYVPKPSTCTFMTRGSLLLIDNTSGLPICWFILVGIGQYLRVAALGYGDTVLSEREVLSLGATGRINVWLRSSSLMAVR